MSKAPGCRTAAASIECKWIPCHEVLAQLSGRMPASALRSFPAIGLPGVSPYDPVRGITFRAR